MEIAGSTPAIASTHRSTSKNGRATALNGKALGQSNSRPQVQALHFPTPLVYESAKHRRIAQCLSREV